MIDLYRDFPCDWDYHGDAYLLLDKLTLPIAVSLQLRFTDTTELNVKIILKDDYRDEDGSFWKTEIELVQAERQAVVIKDRVILMGITHMPKFHLPTVDFRCYQMFIYSGWSHLTFGKNLNDFVRLRAYLNDDFSSFDDIFGVEFRGLPEKQNRNLKLRNQEYFSLYCHLKSGWELKCGKSYVIHNQDLIRKPNIETFYRLSFIDILSLSKVQDKQNLVCQNIHKLELTMHECCAFLSILCGYEILPIYYEFTIYSESLDKEVQGKLLPIREKARISRLSKAWPKQGVALYHNCEAFLECCPLDKQLSNGILQLKTTALDVTSELKLYASCSAIEYFYAYWLRSMGGIQAIESAFVKKSPLLPSNQKFQYSLNEAKKADGRTPALSSTIRFFLDSIGISWKKYIKTSKAIPDFIDIRNNLLHGKYIDDELRITYASQVAEKVAIEIMLHILEKVSKSDVDYYTSIPVEEPINSSKILPNGWSEIIQALDSFINGEQDEIFWSSRTRELWQQIRNSNE